MAKMDTKFLEVVHLGEWEAHDMLSRQVESLRVEVVDLKGRIRFFGECHCGLEQDVGQISKADRHKIEEHIEGGNPMSPPLKKPDPELHPSSEAAALLDRLRKQIESFRQQVELFKGRVKLFEEYHGRLEQDVRHIETRVNNADKDITNLKYANITQCQWNLKIQERLDRIDERIEGGNPISPPPPPKKKTQSKIEPPQ